MHSKSIIALAIACLLAGCTHVPVNDSVLPRMAGNDAEAQLDYWHTVATKNLISNDEAFHGLILYLDQKDDSATYDQRVSLLRSRSMLPRDFHAPANTALERGTLAVPLARILNYKGGITMQLLGTSPRYAMRELEYHGVYPPSSA